MVAVMSLNKRAILGALAGLLLLLSVSADAEALSAKTNAQSLFYFLSWSEMEFMQ